MIKGPILVVAAHADDEVLGCGGTIAMLTQNNLEVHILLLADGESSRDDYENEPSNKKVKNRDSMAEAARKILNCTSLTSEKFPDNRMDSVALLDVVKVIEKQIDKIKPKTIFTHHAGDVNIDHNIVHNAVLAACRPQPDNCVKELLYFEVASSTEWRTPEAGAGFLPNYFVDISDVLPKKIEALEVYSSELRPYPHPRSIIAIKALANWRGATVGVKAAEAFILGRKIISKDIL